MFYNELKRVKLLPVGLALAGLAPFAQTIAARDSQAKKPNVVFILAMFVPQPGPAFSPDSIRRALA